MTERLRLRVRLLAVHVESAATTAKSAATAAAESAASSARRYQEWGK